MPLYDKLNEVGKNIGQTKRDAEAALRRHNPVVPRVERSRDIFDNVIPFEMFFTTQVMDPSITLDLYFNKPPPASCFGGLFGMCCQEFVEGSGSHLVHILNFPYLPGSVSVRINGAVQIPNIQFEEVDSVNGLVYVVGTSATIQYIDVCFLHENLT